MDRHGTRQQLTRHEGDLMTTTLSTSADQELVERVDRLVELEDRTRSQVVYQAVDFWAHLSPEAHAAYRQVRALSPHSVEKLFRRIGREILDAQFELARKRVVAGMRVPAAVMGELSADADDAAFEAAAVRIVTSQETQRVAPRTVARRQR